MTREQGSVAELLLLLDSSELQEAEQAKASVQLQLSSERGGGLIGSLVERYLDSSSPQVLLLLSTTREPLHKVLLEKLNDVLSRPASRLAVVGLLGHLISRQPPWVHHVAHSPVLPALLRLLKTDGEVLVLVTGVLVLVTLLPMIPQAGKPTIYEFFDVFGRLAGWSLKNPSGQATEAQLVHLQAALYSLFQLLYGMFPCSFVSYLRLHYGMKENQETFLLLVQPMLEQVRVHPDLITGSQDSEMDPGRWRCSEVHDIITECARVSLDPLDSFGDDPQLTPPPRLDLCSSLIGGPAPFPDSCVSQLDDVTWSPSLNCGLSTPPPESTCVLHRCMSVSDDSYRPPGDSAPGPTTPRAPAPTSPGSEWEEPSEGTAPPLTDPAHLCLMTPSPRGSASFYCTPPSQNRGRQRAEPPRLSPLQVLDQLIIRGDDAHRHLREWSSRSGGRHGDQGEAAAAQSQEEELQASRSQLLLLHAQLQLERFKGQQHAARNRRLLRRVLDSSALEERSVAMRSQLSVQNQEIQTLVKSLEEEQRRVAQLRRQAELQTAQLQTQQLLRTQREQQTHVQGLQDQVREYENKVVVLEAELQAANHKAVTAERKLSQLSIKVGDGEQLQQQVTLLEQQLLLLMETNKNLRRAGPELDRKFSEATLLRRVMDKELQLLKEAELQQRQRLEAANQRAADMENQLRAKDQLILEHKGLLEDTKGQMRAELSACEAACLSLRQVVQALQTEMLQLYTHLDSPTGRPKSSSSALPVAQVSHKPRPSSASVTILNGRAESPCSSPIDSPLPVGSYLERRARQLFGPVDQLQEEEPGSPPEEGGGAGEGLLLAESSPVEPPLTPPRGPERRRQLTIMDYNLMLPEA